MLVCVFAFEWEQSVYINSWMLYTTENLFLWCFSILLLCSFIISPHSRFSYRLRVLSFFFLLFVTSDLYSRVLTFHYYYYYYASNSLYYMSVHAPNSATVNQIIWRRIKEVDLSFIEAKRFHRFCAWNKSAGKVPTIFTRFLRVLFSFFFFFVVCCLLNIYRKQKGGKRSQVLWIFLWMAFRFSNRMPFYTIRCLSNGEIIDRRRRK